MSELDSYGARYLYDILNLPSCNKKLSLREVMFTVSPLQNKAQQCTIEELEDRIVLLEEKNKEDTESPRLPKKGRNGTNLHLAR
jgi:hypothetical protein